MAAQLKTPSKCISSIPGYMTQDETTLEMHCRDRLFRDVSVFDVTNRKEVFRVTGNGLLSWSLRRSLEDSTGKHLLDFRHFSLDVKNRWIVEEPNHERKLAVIEHVNQLTRSHSAVDATFWGADGGEDAVVEMRPLDRSAMTTTLSIMDSTVAEVSKIADNDIVFNQARGKDRTAWRVRVAANVDLTIVMVMMLCRAEMSHVWRQ
ncbi:hypothetical protein NU195Hw_g1656t1 [Hortaea werneckii]